MIKHLYLYLLETVLSLVYAVNGIASRKAGLTSLFLHLWSVLWIIRLLV